MKGFVYRGKFCFQCRYARATFGKHAYCQRHAEKVAQYITEHVGSPADIEYMMEEG